MSRRLLSVGIGGAGLLVLALAAGAGRRDDRAGRPSRTEHQRPASEAAATQPRLPPPEEFFDSALLRERVRRMEARHRELQDRRDRLAEENSGLNLQLRRRAAEAGARARARERVETWHAALGLTELQKQMLVELCARWSLEDQAGAAVHETWLAREVELGGHLTAGQQARLREHAAAQASGLWHSVKHTLKELLSAGGADRQWLEAAIGASPVSGTLLLPEAHGVEWSSFLREAAARVRPILTALQSSRLDEYLAKF